MSYVSFSTGTLITYSGISSMPLIVSLAPPYTCKIPNSNIFSQPNVYIASSGPIAKYINYKEVIGNPYVGLSGLIFHDLNQTTNFVSFYSCEKLNTLEFKSLSNIGTYILISGLNNLIFSNFDSLGSIGDNFTLIGLNSLQNLNYSSLVTVGGNIEFDSIPNLTGIYLPSLKTIYKNFIPKNLNLVNSITFPSLEIIGGIFNPSNMTGCRSISMPNMIRYESNIIIPSGSMSGITSLNLGTSGILKSINGTRIELSGLNLDVQSVTGLLGLLVSLDGTNGTTQWGAGKTLIINGGANAAPIGQGITDKATLQGRGATITTN